MDPELKAYLDEMRQTIVADLRSDMATKADLTAMSDELRAEIRAGDEETRRHVDTQGRDIRETVAAMEARLTKSIESRREDIDAIGADVVDLQARVKRLERPRAKPK